MKVALLCLALVAPIVAQNAQTLEQRIAQLEAKVAAQQKEIDRLAGMVEALTRESEERAATARARASREPAAAAPRQPAPLPDRAVPESIFSPRPDYSEDARRNRIQGTVVLAVTVRPDGTVDPIITVVRSVGHGLDEQAIKTVKTWTYRPRVQDGRAVEARIQVEIQFKLM